MAPSGSAGGRQQQSGGGKKMTEQQLHFFTNLMMEWMKVHGMGKLGQFREEMKQDLKKTFKDLLSWLRRQDSYEIYNLCFRNVKWPGNKGEELDMRILCLGIMQIRYFMSGVKTERSIYLTDKVTIEKFSELEAYLRCIVGMISMLEFYKEHCRLEYVIKTIETEMNKNLKKHKLPKGMFDKCKNVDITGLLIGKSSIVDEIRELAREEKEKKRENERRKKKDGKKAQLEQVIQKVADVRWVSEWYCRNEIAKQKQGDQLNKNLDSMTSFLGIGDKKKLEVLTNEKYNLPKGKLDEIFRNTENEGGGLSDDQRLNKAIEKLDQELESITQPPVPASTTSNTCTMKKNEIAEERKKKIDQEGKKKLEGEVKEILKKTWSNSDISLDDVKDIFKEFSKEINDEDSDKDAYSSNYVVCDNVEEGYGVNQGEVNAYLCKVLMRNLGMVTLGERVVSSFEGKGGTMKKIGKDIMCDLLNLWLSYYDIGNYEMTFDIVYAFLAMENIGLAYRNSEYRKCEYRGGSSILGGRRNDDFFKVYMWLIDEGIVDMMDTISEIVECKGRGWKENKNYNVLDERVNRMDESIKEKAKKIVEELRKKGENVDVYKNEIKKIVQKATPSPKPPRPGGNKALTDEFNQLREQYFKIKNGEGENPMHQKELIDDIKKMIDDFHKEMEKYDESIIKDGCKEFEGNGNPCKKDMEWCRFILGNLWRIQEIKKGAGERDDSDASLKRLIECQALNMWLHFYMGTNKRTFSTLSQIYNARERMCKSKDKGAECSKCKYENFGDLYVGQENVYRIIKEKVEKKKGTVKEMFEGIGDESCREKTSSEKQDVPEVIDQIKEENEKLLDGNKGENSNKESEHDKHGKVDTTPNQGKKADLTDSNLAKKGKSKPINCENGGVNDNMADAMKCLDDIYNQNVTVKDDGDNEDDTPKFGTWVAPGTNASKINVTEDITELFTLPTNIPSGEDHTGPFGPPATPQSSGDGSVVPSEGGKIEDIPPLATEVQTAQPAVTEIQTPVEDNDIDAGGPGGPTSNDADPGSSQPPVQKTDDGSSATGGHSSTTPVTSSTTAPSLPGLGKRKGKILKAASRSPGDPPPPKVVEWNIWDIRDGVLTPYLPTIPVLMGFSVMSYLLWKYFALPSKRRRYRRDHQVRGPPILQEQLLHHVEQADGPHAYTLVKKRRQPRSAPTGRRKRPKKQGIGRRHAGRRRRDVRRRMIIDIHLEVLDECQKGDFHSTKEDYFTILVQEFMGSEFIKEEKVPEKRVSIVDVPKEDFLPEECVPKEQVPSSDSGFREERLCSYGTSS